MTIKGVDTTEYSLTGATLKAGGYSFVCRYIQNFPTGTLDKEMRRSELVEKTAAGIRVVANWEWAAVPPNTRSRGQDDAHAAKARLASLGVPDWAPVYYSVDTRAQAGDYNAYAAGWRDVYPAHQLGVYGDGALFRQLKADGYVKYAWQSMSLSFPGNHKADGSWNHAGADIIQTNSGHIGTHSCDFDTATDADYGGFLLGEEDPNMALTTADAELVVKTLVNDINFQYMIARLRVMAEMDDTYPAGSPATVAGDPVAFTKAIKAIPTTAVPGAPIDLEAVRTIVTEEITAALNATRLASS